MGDNFKRVPANNNGRAKRKPIYGIATNDAEYMVAIVVDGKTQICPLYRCWFNMLNRCYGGAYKKDKPSYDGCTVCDEWMVFSNFSEWMESQDWMGKHLDKDIILNGNKVYSPSVCAFITPKTNSFMTLRGRYRGDLPIGVFLNGVSDKYIARCSDGNGQLKHLGVFDTDKDAHSAWAIYKSEVGASLAANESDERVVNALVTMESRFLGMYEQDKANGR